MSSTSRPNASESVSSESTEPVEQPESSQTPEPEQESTPEPEQESSNQEAAKWRVKLRDEQKAHQDTQTVLQDLRRQMVDDQLQNAGTSAALLEAAGTDLNSLWTGNQLDFAALKSAIETAREKFNLPKPTPFGYNPNQGTGAPTPGNSGESGPTWSDAFQAAIHH